jgi:hypothetical protein
MSVVGFLAALDEGESQLDQAIAVLRASGFAEPGRMTLGEGDRALLMICRLFTRSDIDVVAACPACSELSEATIAPECVPGVTPRSAILGSGGGLRAPTYDDLHGLPLDRDLAISELLTRCVVASPTRDPSASDFDLVDDSLVGPVMLACPTCGTEFDVDLDVQTAVLQRLTRRVREMDNEVHLLASKYGWSLADIESLGDDRRRYLAELVSDSR